MTSEATYDFLGGDLESECNPPSTLFQQIDRKIMPKTVHQATALCLSRSSDATVELHFSKCKLSVWTPPNWIFLSL